MNKILLIVFVLFLYLLPSITFSQTSNFYIEADTNAVRGNLNQAYSDCGTCNARFHVIAYNFYDKNVAWTLISAPTAYYNCGSQFFADNYNCIEGDCTFHMHGVPPGEYIIAAQDMDYPGAPITVISDTIKVIIRSVNNGSVTNITSNLICNGDLSGSISVQSTLQGPLTYLWSNGNSSSSLSSLSAGTYTVTVTDAHKCQIVESILVTEPIAISITPILANNQIPGPNSGSIDLILSGGTTPYNFQWSSGATTQQITQLAAGTYMVTVTDANNCVKNRMYRLDADSIQSTGIYNYENDAVGIHPNPFNDRIYLTFNNNHPNDFNIDVSNVLGKIVFHQEIKNGNSFENEIDLAHLPSGIYFLKLTGYRLNKTSRFIKQK